VTTDLYFAGRRIVSNFWFYPYGEEPFTTAQDRDKFATYYRDGTTGLDYAQNRYYSSILGRFLTADPSKGTDPNDPGTWNRYAYASNDPVNRLDPAGLDDQSAEGGITLDCSITDWNVGFTSWWPSNFCELMLQDQSRQNQHRSGGGGGGGRISGLSVALSDLSAISKGSFESKSKCKDFFNALAKQLDPKLGITGQQLMDEVVTVANDAVLKGNVFDGPSSMEKLDATRFPGMASAGVNTVGAWFGNDCEQPRREVKSTDGRNVSSAVPDD
jgi:RHS repeat-associated protein